MLIQRDNSRGGDSLQKSHLHLDSYNPPPALQQRQYTVCLNGTGVTFSLPPGVNVLLLVKSSGKRGSLLSRSFHFATSKLCAGTEPVPWVQLSPGREQTSFPERYPSTGCSTQYISDCRGDSCGLKTYCPLQKSIICFCCAIYMYTF